MFQIPYSSCIFAQVLDESSDYPSALNQITNTPTAAPVYFILGGRQAGEGALIVRNGLDVAVVKTLKDYLDHRLVSTIFVILRLGTISVHYEQRCLAFLKYTGSCCFLSGFIGMGDSLFTIKHKLNCGAPSTIRYFGSNG